MKKTLSLLTLTCAVFAAATAQAAQNAPYVSAGFGLFRLSDATLTDPTGSVDAAFDNGPAFTLAGGYEFDDVRAELEFGYRKNGIDSFSAFGASVPGSGDVSAKSLMLNLFHDFRNDSGVAPWLGFGLGMTRLDVDDAAVAGIPIGDADDTVFGAQLLAGIGIRVTETAILDLGYRYLATADPDFEGTSAEYSGHGLTAGVRISF